MKRYIIVLSAVIFTLSFLSSCTIEKRVYTSGYHVEWKKHQRITPFISTQDDDESANVRKEQVVSSEFVVRQAHHDMRKADLAEKEKVYEEQVIPNYKPVTLNPKPVTLNPIPIAIGTVTLNPLSTAFSFTQRGYSILSTKEGRNTDELLLGILLFIGGIAAMIAVAYAYSGFNPLPGTAILFLVLCFIVCLVGYILIEDAVPGLGCLLLTLFQIFAAVL